MEAWDAGLAPKALQSVVVVRQPGGKHLQRHGAARVLLLGLVDLAHAALAEQADDLEVVDGLASLQHGQLSAVRGLTVTLSFPMAGGEDRLADAKPVVNDK